MTRCTYCRALRPEREMIRVTDRRRVWRTRLVCRPSVSRRECFRFGTGTAEDERIELADPRLQVNAGAALLAAMREREEADEAEARRRARESSDSRPPRRGAES
jgi:hypothetical protein